MPWSACSLSLVVLLDGAVFFALVFVGARDPFLLLPAVVLCHVLTCAAIVRLLMIFHPIKEGTFDRRSPEADRWVAQAAVSLVSVILFDPLVPFFLKGAWYRLFGARIGPGATIAGRLIDCSLTRLGPGVQLGAECLVLGHYVVGDTIRIGRVTLEENAVAGARSLVLPGSAIGKGAVLGAMSFLPAGRTIPEGQTWAGNPAVRVDVRERAARTDHAPFRTGTAGIPHRIQEQLRQFVRDNWGEPHAEDPLDAEIPDSLAWVQVLAFVEDRFGVAVSEQELAERCSGSLRELASLIRGRDGDGEHDRQASPALNAARW
jgi:serine acetyltransferase